MFLLGRKVAQHEGHGDGPGRHEDGNNAEDVAPAPQLRDVPRDRGTDQGGEDPREGEPREEGRAASGSDEFSHEDVERDDKETAAEALQGAPRDEDNDSRRERADDQARDEQGDTGNKNETRALPVGQYPGDDRCAQLGRQGSARGERVPCGGPIRRDDGRHDRRGGQLLEGDKGDE